MTSNMSLQAPTGNGARHLGAPEGEGAACGQGDRHLQDPVAPPDDGARVCLLSSGRGIPGERNHSGRMQTGQPDDLWGTDVSRLWTGAEGWCWFFAAVDHCASDIVGWHVAKKGDRWEAALELVRQCVRARWATSARPSPWASVCGMTGARSTGQGSSSPRLVALGGRQCHDIGFAY